MGGDVDPRSTAALLLQRDRRREAFNAGAGPVGWKLGVGHLTTASLLAADATISGNAGSLKVIADVGALGCVSTSAQPCFRRAPR